MKKLLILLFTSHLVFSQQNSEIKVGSVFDNDIVYEVNTTFSYTCFARSIITMLAIFYNIKDLHLLVI